MFKTFAPHKATSLSIFCMKDLNFIISRNTIKRKDALSPSKKQRKNIGHNNAYLDNIISLAEYSSFFELYVQPRQGHLIE